ncbi:enolase C-terminal domain-like protein [Propionimicrobium sp. PCR01-08-3]|uniref:enolase C-terminal domain-like protein n=1 Tax=Propionimicrobium sp. PCR01-08-3 TaxID=3052086 RepID=UPI00255C89DE|nr:enolase C-terminal domain-like protein [Propionimicrobium sp. PCR01-08-3]WIY81761.1 enolase C-terminal domain-like protein [Propionimicrobium sp. PCR01-08-3]
MIGGQVHEYLPTHLSVFASSLDDLVRKVGVRVSQGFTKFRAMVEGPDFGHPKLTAKQFASSTAEILTTLTAAYGDELGFTVDVHGRYEPQELFHIAQALEPFNLVYLEDPFPPEHLDWLPLLRSKTAQPIAIGEVFTLPEQYQKALADHSIDVVRSHLSMIGGFTPGLKLAHVAEYFGSQVTFHGPTDLSPVGHAANIAIELASPNVRVHEHHQPAEQTQRIFPGAPIAEAGRIYPWMKPGWGVDFIPEEAAKYPALPDEALSSLEGHRSYDGVVARP